MPRVATFSMQLPVRAPLDWDGLLAFLGPRATPSVERIDPTGSGSALRRSFRVEGTPGVVQVGGPLARRGGPPNGQRLPVRVHVARAEGEARRRLARALRVRLVRVFDLDTDPAAPTDRLGRDRMLARELRLAAGVRVPGAFDPFEVTVRAILGQQVTVKGATTLAGRLVTAHGEALPRALSKWGPTHLFPRPEALAGADLTGIGLPRRRAEAISGLAAAFAEGRVALDPDEPAEDQIRALRALPGIGSWTAEYVAMRVLGESDAFPASDLGLRKALARGGELPSVAAVTARAERWRPFRAYAAMLLWRRLARDG